MTCDYAACPREAVVRLDGFQFCPSHQHLHAIENTTSPFVSTGPGPDLLPSSPVGGLLLPCESLAPLYAVLNRTEQEVA